VKLNTNILMIILNSSKDISLEVAMDFDVEKNKYELECVRQHCE